MVKNKSNSNNGTSLVEQSLFYFLKMFFPDAVNRHCIKHNGMRIEIDIYLPSLNYAIEYDGSYWHENKMEFDNKKNRILNENGFTVLRIREYGLPELEPFDGNTINLPYVHLNVKNYDYINEPIKYFTKLVDKKLAFEMQKFKVDNEVYNSALKEIYALRFCSEVTANITNICGIEFWDNKLNGQLKPENVGIHDLVPAYFTCKEGKTMYLSRYKRNIKPDCMTYASGCVNCVFQVFCPMIGFCQGQAKKFYGENMYINGKLVTESVECLYVEKKIWDMINKGGTLNGLYGLNAFKDWLIKRSTIGKKMLSVFTSKRTTKKMKENIVRFLGYDVERYKQEIKEGTFDIYSLF